MYNFVVFKVKTMDDYSGNIDQSIADNYGLIRFEVPSLQLEVVGKPPFPTLDVLLLDNNAQSWCLLPCPFEHLPNEIAATYLNRQANYQSTSNTPQEGVFLFDLPESALHPLISDLNLTFMVKGQFQEVVYTSFEAQNESKTK